MRALRLRGGMDAAQQHEFEAILECLQQPNASPQQRQHAQQFALKLQNPLDFSEIDPHVLAQAADANTRRQLTIEKRLTQLQHLLDNSHSPTVQVVACNSLTALVTNHWDNNTLPHVEIRNYALSFLFAQASAQTAPAFVVRAMTRLLSRITRLGWLTCETHRGVLQALNRFYDASVAHYVMGLQLMFDLVEELDVPALTRRELVLKRQFLTMALLKMFQTAVDTLQKLQTQMIPEPEQAARLTDAALQLAVRCLSYDFIGHASLAHAARTDDDNDLATLAVPLSWKSDLSNPALTDMLFAIVGKFSAPQAGRALELLLLLSSVPRSLYETPASYADTSGRVFNGVRDLFASRRGLEERETHHAFCRLLGALRDIDAIGRQRKGDEYKKWLTLAANFTCDALRDVETPSNSMHYLLQFWSRLVAASRTTGSGLIGSGQELLAQLVRMQQEEVEDVHGGAAKRSEVHEFVPRVVDSFIAGRLDSVEAAIEGRIEDPLDDVEMLQTQLEVLPRISALQYADIGGKLVKTIDMLQPMYEHALATGNAGQVQVVEAKMAWLVRVCAAMIGGHYTLETQIKIEGSRVMPSVQMGTCMQDGDELIDADVSRRMLQLIMLVQNNVVSANRRCDYRHV
jgi:exportin-7